MSVYKDALKFYNKFKGEKGILGKSVLGVPLYYFKVQKTPYPVVIAQYAMHAREYITTYLAIKQIKEFEKNGKKGCVYFIPLVNPDGVEIVEKGKPLYKANAREVDLNVNFDADWGKGKYNQKFKGDANFIGEKPFSEPETIALKEFTLKVKPDMTFSYHSKGEEVYWFFGQMGERLKRDEFLAKTYAKTSGYEIKYTPFSSGGYKDWCVQKLKIPALTIEVGEDFLSHPIKKEYQNKIYKKNKGALNKTILALSEKKWT